jgi:TonB family protein
MEKRLNGLYRTNGQQILPTEYYNIEYLSERHPLIATLPANGSTQFKAAFDLNGKALLPAEFSSLRFTHDPNILFGCKEVDSKFALIDLRSPGKAVYEYDELSRMNNGYLVGMKNNRYFIFNPDGRLLIGDQNWHNVSGLDKRDYEAYRATQGASGTPIVSARTSGLTLNQVIMVNEKGKVIKVTLPEQALIPMMPPPVSTRESDAVAVEEMAEEAPKPQPKASETAPAQPVDKIYNSFEVQKLPMFPGGEQALYMFIGKNLTYPEAARKAAIQGTVAVKFVIEKDGSVSNIQIVRDIGSGCGEAAINMIKAMPKWTPGEYQGQVVRTAFMLPVRFKLE